MLSPRATLHAGVLLALLAGAAPAAPAPPELRWAGDAEGGAPYVEAAADDPTRVVGFDVEVAQLLGAGLGRRARFVQDGFTTLDAAVARGDFDIAISAAGTDLKEAPGIRLFGQERGMEAFHALQQKTGVLPVNHGMVIQKKFLADRPALPRDIYDAFLRSKEAAYQREPRSRLVFPQLDPVRQRLRLDASFALPHMLQGGTWAAGRKVAMEKRPPNGPPPVDRLPAGGSVELNLSDADPRDGDRAAQGLGVARRGQHRAAGGFEAFGQTRVAGAPARPGEGLVFPGPGGVAAAATLVFVEGGGRGHQQAGAAVGAQRGVDLEQLPRGGAQGQPGDQLAHEGGIDLLRAVGVGLGIVVVEEDHVQVAAVAQLQPAQLAVGDHGELRLVAVAVFHALPAPACGHAQYRIGQCAQVIGHLLHRQHTFYIACQGPELFGVVRAAPLQATARGRTGTPPMQIPWVDGHRYG